MKFQLFPLLLIVLFCFSACDSKDLLEQSSSTVKTTTPNNLSPQQKQSKQINQFNLDIQHYFNSINRSNFDEVVEMIYPGMYRGKTKKEMQTNLLQSKIRGMERKIEQVKIEKITDVLEDERNLYCKIYYTAIAKIQLSGEMLENKEFIKTNLELSYDTQEIEFDGKNTYTIPDAYSTMIAISQKGSNLWKYIEVDKQKEAYLGQVVPQKILDQLD